MQLTYNEFEYLGRCLAGFFFGFYSGIFAMHLQYHASKKEPNNTKYNITFYALCVLYVLSAALMALETASFVVYLFNDEVRMGYFLAKAQGPVFAFCDFITQSILIFRCWMVWGRNIRVVIIPSIIAFSYLVMWTTCTGALGIQKGRHGFDETQWGKTLAVVCLTASMTVNALVTSLIVLRILKVFREVKGIATADEKRLGITGGRKLRSIILAITESGMALFVIQFARASLALLLFWTDGGYDGYLLISGIHEMLNGITPTLILVRVSMGFSFHDEPSLVETVGNLHFAADRPNPNGETGSISEDESL